MISLAKVLKKEKTNCLFDGFKLILLALSFAIPLIKISQSPESLLK
ncbi:MAG: hypothetical protein WAO75_02095 [Atribacterales bacterium]